MAPKAELHLDGAPDGASRARALAAAALRDLPDDLVGDVQLVLTELVSNAGLHGRPPIVARVGREDDGAVRVEVEDAGRHLLVIPVPSPDAMTGRGLSLVARLASSWGTDLGRGGGKCVWAVLRPGSDGSGDELPSVDVDAILAGWDDDEPEPLFTVHLGAVATDLLLDAKRHMDNVVRELTLVRAGAVGGRALPPQVDALVDTVTGSFVRARSAIKRQAAAAATRGDVETELTLTLPASSADAGERYLAALDEVDRYARDARLLTLETPPLHALFRRWYVQALVDQLRALSHGRQPAPARAFVQVLSDEVTALSALRTSAQRLALLQKINAELSAVGTPQDIADVVVRNATQELGAVGARVLVADGNALRTLAAADEDDGRVDSGREVSLSADLPEPAVFLSGAPLALRGGQAGGPRFADLHHALPDDRSVHLAPLTAGRHRLGVLVIEFPVLGEHAEDTQATFVQAVADAVAQNLELHALRVQFESDRQRWDLAIEAAGVGSFDWDLTTGRLDWDERMQALFGYAPGEFRPHTDDGFARIDPQDRPLLDDAVDAAIKTCGDFRAEYRVLLPSGDVRWIAARGRAVAGADGAAARLIGTAHDVSEVRSARDEAARLMETMATGFLALDHDWRMTYLNAEGARVVGLRAEDVVGRDLWEVFPGLDETPFGAAYRHAMATRQAGEVEGYYAHLDSWYQVRMEPSADGLYSSFTDVSQRRTDQERARSAAARLQLLADAGEQLAAAGLDVEDAVARLSRVVVPALADWCLVSLVSETGRVRDVGQWHADPALRPVLDAYVRARWEDRTGLGAVQEARATGEPVVGAGERTAAVLGPEVAEGALAELETGSAVAVPLVARGHVIGALTVCRGRERPPLTPDELTTAQEVASRAALALDNARLYREQRSLAAALQRSLMTAPPEPDHAEIAVRYVPAAKAASVGGDWYDAFLGRDGATVVVIGDVMGHDHVAAAAMAQLRSLLRGIAWHTGGNPAEVLTGLDAAMRGLQIETTATAVVARLEQAVDHCGREVTRLRWSSAGHPPPLTVTPDGTVEVLEGGAVDLLLGLDCSSSRTDTVVALPPGCTVLLYSDGLIERRGQDLDTGLGLLRTTLADVAALPLDELCDEVLRRLLPDDADDDAALVAVRLHPGRRAPAGA